MANSNELAMEGGMHERVLWYLKVRVLRLLKKRLPYNRMGDWLHLYGDFLRFNGRAPGSRDYFNDRLFELFTSSEIIDPVRQFTSDKELSKIFATGVIGRNVSVPTLAVLRTEDEILNYDFPGDCVIKATHSAGMTIIREDGSPLDRKEICRWLSFNIYEVSREANYRNLHPKVIVEPVLFPGSNVDDFKIFCLNGKAKTVLYVGDRNKNFGRAFFDLNWKKLDVEIEHPLLGGAPAKPSCLDQVIDLTEQLASYFGLVRIDWFIHGNEFYLGEITHGHMRGLEQFSSEASERLLTQVIFG